MTHRAKLSLVGLAWIGTGVGLAAWLGASRWKRKTLYLVEKFIQPTPSHEMKTVSFANFGQLPVPVAKYLRLALTEGQPFIRSVRLVQTGELRHIGKSQGGWMPFEAVQYVSAQPLGFVWDALIRPFSLMQIRVRDAFVDGQGTAQVSALSLVTLADETGKPELNAGALMRYLAEAVWFPTALLPTAKLEWSSIDDTKALATLTESGTTVSLEFSFNDIGEITSVYTPCRYAAIDGKYELTPWGGHHRNYKEKDNMRIPTEGEVEWHLSSGIFPVWKGENVKAEYDFAQ